MWGKCPLANKLSTSKQERSAIKIRKAFNLLLIVVLLLTGFSVSPVSTSAKSVEETGIDQMNTFSVLAGLGAESQGLTQIEGHLGIAAEGAEALGDWRVRGEKHLGPESLAEEQFLLE